MYVYIYIYRNVSENKYIYIYLGERERVSTIGKTSRCWFETFCDSPLHGEMIKFDSYFFQMYGSTTN